MMAKTLFQSQSVDVKRDHYFVCMLSIVSMYDSPFRYSDHVITSLVIASLAQ